MCGGNARRGGVRAGYGVSVRGVGSGARGEVSVRGHVCTVWGTGSGVRGECAWCGTYS